MVGLYGVVAYSVSQRTRELGIRVALGAQRFDLCKALGSGLVIWTIGFGSGLTLESELPPLGAAAQNAQWLCQEIAFGVLLFSLQPLALLTRFGRRLAPPRPPC